MRYNQSPACRQAALLSNLGRRKPAPPADRRPRRRPRSYAERVTVTTRPVPDAATTWRPDHPVDVGTTLAPLGRGRGDPCHRATPDGALWRASRLPTGPVSYRLLQRGPRTIFCEAWGPGAPELVTGLPELLGGRDDPAGFEPGHPLLHEAHRHHPGLRVPRTGRVFEALVPAVLEQKVTGRQARAAWRWLVGRYGTPAPGPVPPGLRLPPGPEGWRRIPSWDWHRAGVEPSRSATIVACARVAARLEECVDLPPAEAEHRLRLMPGVGVWTAAEVAQRAWGNADALSVGDYHLAGFVGWSLLGRPLDDAGMVDFLNPWRPHRYRVVRLLELSPRARKPRFGPRMTIQDHRHH